MRHRGIFGSAFWYVPIPDPLAHAHPRGKLGDGLVSFARTHEVPFEPQRQDRFLLRLNPAGCRGESFSFDFRSRSRAATSSAAPGGSLPPLARCRISAPPARRPPSRTCRSRRRRGSRFVFHLLDERRYPAHQPDSFGSDASHSRVRSLDDAARLDLDRDRDAGPPDGDVEVGLGEG